MIGAEYALDHSSADDDPASTDIGTNVKNLAAYTKYIDKSKRSSMKNTTQKDGVGYSSSIHDESVDHLPSVKIKPTSGQSPRGRLPNQIHGEGHTPKNNRSTMTSLDNFKSSHYGERRLGSLEVERSHAM